MIQGAWVLACNDYEVELIMKILRYKNIQIIQSLVDILIIRHRVKGSVVRKGNKKIRIKAARPKKLVDPTGAGDAYRAGFIKGLIENWDLKRCGKLAAWAAKHPVEFYGTQEHRFRYKS